MVKTNAPCASPQPIFGPREKPAYIIMAKPRRVSARSSPLPLAGEASSAREKEREQTKKRKMRLMVSVTVLAMAVLVLVLELAAEESTSQRTDDAVTAGLVATVVASNTTAEGAHEAAVALLLHGRVSGAVGLLLLWRVAVRVGGVRGVWRLVVGAGLRELLRRRGLGIGLVRGILWISAIWLLLLLVLLGMRVLRGIAGLAHTLLEAAVCRGPVAGRLLAIGIVARSTWLLLWRIALLLLWWILALLVLVVGRRIGLARGRRAVGLLGVLGVLAVWVGHGVRVRVRGWVRVCGEKEERGEVKTKGG